MKEKNRKSWDRAKNGKKEGGIDEQTTPKYSIYRQKNEKNEKNEYGSKKKINKMV